MGQYSDISLDQINQATNIGKEQKAAGNVAASREIQTGIQAAQPSMVQSYFEGESRNQKTQYALEDARAQTGTMKQAMQMQRENFDDNMKNERRLASMDAGAAKTLLAETKQFQMDSAGRKYLNERQLADWYNTRAASDEDWSSYQQRSQQLHDRKLQILSAAYKRIEQQEKQAYMAGAASMDRDTQTTIAQMKANLAKKLEDEKKKAANSSMMVSALGTIGTVVGGIYGGPAGAVGGGVAGSALGKELTK